MWASSSQYPAYLKSITSVSFSDARPGSLPVLQEAQMADIDFFCNLGHTSLCLQQVLGPDHAFLVDLWDYSLPSDVFFAFLLFNPSGALHTSIPTLYLTIYS